jgi:hypothetical protein
MRRFLSAALLGAGLLTGPALVHAADAPPPPVAQSSGSGVAVVAIGDAPAQDLAREIYARPSLRPAFDEAHARVLTGEAPAPDAPREISELAETRAAIHGDDAPSRRLLGSLATTLHVKVIVVVMPSTDPRPIARAFLADSGVFDAARYAPDAADGGALDWAAVVASMDRAYGVRSLRAPTLATTPIAAGAADDKEGRSRPFYTSPWFWAAVGAAAFGGVALYFATRDNGPGTIHLQLQVPK